MLSEKLIYVYLSGEVEGFLGIGLTMGEAHKDAIKKIKCNLETIGEKFDELQVKKDLKGLTVDERNKVLEDFKKYI